MVKMRDMRSVFPWVLLLSIGAFAVESPAGTDAKSNEPKDREETARVFVGKVTKIVERNKFSGTAISTDVDPRWAVTFAVNKIESPRSADDVKEQTYLIHSPSRIFVAVEKAEGRTFRITEKLIIKANGEHGLRWIEATPLEKAEEPRTNKPEKKSSSKEQ